MTDDPGRPALAPPPADPARPLVSMLLLAYRQQATVGEAIAGALAQTWSPLEIVISDDASPDGTWAAIERAVAGYDGPHRLVLNRNAVNLGLGAHLSRLVELSSGELLLAAAGDDVSLPERCERTAAAWLAHGRAPDVIAASLIDVDDAGARHGVLRPSDLSRWKSAADWAQERPHVIGAAQAFTRRLFDRFGPLPPGSVAEDLIIVFRGIVSGGAITIDEPLVEHRRGGLSQRRRALHADEVRERLRRTAAHSLAEIPQLLADAGRAGVLGEVETTLGRQLARERHVAAQLGAAGLAGRLRRFAADRDVPLATRLRVLVYAQAPQLLAPFFALKRSRAGRRRG